MERLLISTAELAEVLSIGRTTVYKLVHTPGFPTVNIGGKILIPTDALREWINANKNE